MQLAEVLALWKVKAGGDGGEGREQEWKKIKCGMNIQLPVSAISELPMTIQRQVYVP